MWMRRTLGPFSRKCFLPGCGEDSWVCNIYWGGDGGRNPMQTATRPGGKVSRQMRGTLFEAADWKTYHESPFRSWKLQTGRGEVSVEHDTAARLTRPSCNLHERQTENWETAWKLHRLFDAASVTLKKLSVMRGSQGAHSAQNPPPVGPTEKSLGFSRSPRFFLELRL